ncbi:hypothetical protein [Streptomyces sp. NPDC002845]
MLVLVLVLVLVSVSVSAAVSVPVRGPGVGGPSRSEPNGPVPGSIAPGGSVRSTRPSLLSQ